MKKLARTHGIGYNIGGPTGYRFTDADIDKMRALLRPVPQPTKRRRIRRPG